MFKAPSQPLPFLTRRLPVAALLVPLCLLTLIGWLNWNAAWRNATDDMQRAATSIAEYGKQALESYASAAGRVNDRLRGMSDDDVRANERALHQDLKQIYAELSRAEQGFVMDRNGRPLLSSDIYPVPANLDLSDREFFQALAAEGSPEAYVSRTFISRINGKLLFAVARPRQNTGNGLDSDAFDGIVVISVSPMMLAEGMRRLLSKPTDQLALMRPDGHGISTTSGRVEARQTLPQVASGSPFYTFVDQGAQQAVYVSQTALTGGDALLAMELMGGFPIYAVSVRPKAEIVAEWRETMIPYLAFAAPAALALFLLSVKVVRDQRELQVRNASLTSFANLTADRLGRAKRFGLVGTFEYDLRTGVSRRSPEYMSVQGLPAVATDETHDDWERRLYPDDKARALEELRWALSDESGAEEYGQSYRIVTPDGSVRWIAARGVIRRDENGRAIMLLGAHTDVTPLRSSEIALAESDARLRLAHEAVGIGTWEWVPKARRLFCSNRMMEIFGFDLDTGPPRLSQVFARIHPEDREVLRDHLKAIQRTERFHCEFRVVRPGHDDVVWVSARAALVALTRNATSQVMGIVHDITDQKQSEDMVRLMANEVEHRAKNTLALISAMLRMTKAGSAAELAQLMQGRIRALGNTMGILRKSRWAGADLAEILADSIAPFAGPESAHRDSVRLSGPAVHISVEAAQPVSLAVHELATNASKYGSLSVPDGKLDVSWYETEGRVHVRWVETGGPPVENAPHHAGFGSKLIVLLFETQLGGSVTRDWLPTGLVCQISFPLNTVLSSQPD